MLRTGRGTGGYTFCLAGAAPTVSGEDVERAACGRLSGVSRETFDKDQARAISIESGCVLFRAVVPDEIGGATLWAQRR